VLGFRAVDDVKARIETLVRSAEVVLFIKGTRAQPRCGFSATVVDILDDYLDDYVTVDVLSDESIRQGIKDYSDWPTIPQLFVEGELVGGSDIVREMKQSGELEKVLGKEAMPLRTPEIVLTEDAIAALEEFWDGDGTPVVRLEIDRGYRNAIFFDEPRDEDLVMSDRRFTLVMDKGTARRADGVTIDFVRMEKVSGFKVDNPNEPPRVRQLSAKELSSMLDGGKPLELFDVRTPGERATAQIGGTLLDEAGRERLESLERDTALAFYCHHGIRSQAAAEHALRMGFREVYNLAGGIDAWSQEVDSEIPRY
jgi:monothiol glutaredoxin